MPDLVKIIRGQDVLLHHPYVSFETVVKLLEAAAQEKSVVAIRQTLYRTGKGSAIVGALIEAAKQGESRSRPSWNYALVLMKLLMSNSLRN